MKFIDRPLPLPSEAYDRALERMTGRLRRLPGLTGLYRLGSIKDPGISDIDLLAVFEDHYATRFDPRRHLTRTDRYLFAHRLFGLCERDFQCLMSRPSFFCLTPLFGPAPLEARPGNGAGDEIRTQVALEYLIGLWISFAMQKKMATIKLRSLFLQTNAALIDLEALKKKGSELYILAKQVRPWRKSWFENPDRMALAEWIVVLFEALDREMRSLLHDYPFYHQSGGRYRLSGNVTVLSGRRIGYICRTRGPFRSFPAPGSKRIYNALNRLNSYTFHFPVKDVRIVPPLHEKLLMEHRARAHNRTHLPHFAPLVSPLSLTPY